MYILLQFNHGNRFKKFINKKLKVIESKKRDS